MMNLPRRRELMHISGPVGRAHRSLIVVGAVAIGAALAGCSSGTSSAPATTAGPTASSGAAPTAPPKIAISNFMFVPASLTVAPGATVTVTNRDQVAHTLTSSSGGFNTGDIAPGTSGTFTAPSHPGHYAYICSIHQYMSGTLTVS
jgi:plastocyanin